MQFGTVEEPWLNQVNTLKPGIHLQAVHAVNGHRFAMNVLSQREAVTDVVQQTPFKSTQQGFQRPPFGQCQQCSGVVIE